MREQKEQEKQNELLRVVAEQNHERLIEYDVKEDRAVVYAIENDRFEVLFDIEDYVKKNSGTMIKFIICKIKRFPILFFAISALLDAECAKRLQTTEKHGSRVTFSAAARLTE